MLFLFIIRRQLIGHLMMSARKRSDTPLASPQNRNVNKQNLKKLYFASIFHDKRLQNILI